MTKFNPNDKIQFEGITREQGEIGVEFLFFLEYFEGGDHKLPTQVRSYYYDLEKFMQGRCYPELKEQMIRKLADMYVHKILLPKLKQLKKDGEE